MKLLRKILIPIVPVYYIVTWLRNYFYDKGIFESKSYDFPVICVGNLSVGGTGKTPMIEYLVRILQNNYKVAVLSRGYKRKSKGFHLASKRTKIEDVGDEPFQFYSKFENVFVAVDANRQNGISELRKQVNPDIILLDDAFQHRKVNAGFNILLTTYDNLFVHDMLLPTGDLREPKKGANRANVIVVTKCPENVSEAKKQDILNAINPNENQTVFFSSILYSRKLKSLDDEIELDSLIDTEFSLVTGIANAEPLVNYLRSQGFIFEHLNFGDHHDFTSEEIEMIQSKKLVITTEKDYMRLKKRVENNLYYLPIEVKLNNQEMFDSKIRNYLNTVKQ